MEHRDGSRSFDWSVADSVQYQAVGGWLTDPMHKSKLLTESEVELTSITTDIGEMIKVRHKILRDSQMKSRDCHL